MTKDELVELVDQVYATYRTEMPHGEAEVKATLNAWYEMLHDLEASDVKRIFRNLAVVDEFLPRPGKLRRLTIDATTKIPPFDDPITAWGKWLTLTQEVNSGMPPSIPASEVMTLTVKALGQAAYNLHTNADRNVFCAMYEKILATVEGDKYAVPDPPTKKMP